MLSYPPPITKFEGRLQWESRLRPCESRELIKEIDSCFHRKPWIPHPPIGVEGRQVRNDRKEEMITVAVLTLSDKGSEGKREDRSGLAIEELIKEIDAKVVSYNILPDEKELIKEKLLSLCSKVDLILTTGGTGLSPRDVTPEATQEVITQEIPGIAEAMRYEGLKKTPYAMLSRAVAGTRDRTLIINLPGSPVAVKENLTVILPCLSHAIEKIKGSKAECARPESRSVGRRHGIK